MNWKSMESAPRDGQVILGDYGCDEVHTVMYRPDWHGEGKGAWRASCDDPEFSDWSEPRRWMPVPLTQSNVGKSDE